MIGSPSAIISLGLGSWAEAGSIITLGFGFGDYVAPVVETPVTGGGGYLPKQPQFHPWIHKQRKPDEEKILELIEEEVEKEIIQTKKELKKVTRKAERYQKKEEPVPQDTVLYMRMLEIELIKLEAINVERIRKELETEQDVIFVMTILANLTD